MPGTTLDSGIQEYAKQSCLYFLELAAYESSFKKIGKMLYVNCTKRSRRVAPQSSGEKVCLALLLCWY